MTPLTHRSNFNKNPTQLRGVNEVMATLSDKRRSVCNEELGIAYFEAEVLKQTDYYPFGAVMPERQWSAGAEGYRYGFNGMEKDDETYGKGNALDFGARIYDSRLGRWLSVDALFFKFDGYSPYNFTLDNPIAYHDKDGEDVWVGISATTSDYSGHAQMYVTNYKKVMMIVNGQLVERYVKDGYKIYSLSRDGYTISPITGQGDEPDLSDKEGGYKVYDMNATPIDKKGNVEYFTKEQIQMDLDVDKKLTDVALKDRKYDVKMNNCVDYVQQGLRAIDPNLGAIGNESLKDPIIKKLSFEVGTPNELGRDLGDTLKPEQIIKKDEDKLNYKTQDYINNPKNRTD